MCRRNQCEHNERTVWERVVRATFLLNRIQQPWVMGRYGFMSEADIVLWWILSLYRWNYCRQMYMWAKCKIGSSDTQLSAFQESKGRIWCLVAAIFTVLLTCQVRYSTTAHNSMAVCFEKHACCTIPVRTSSPYPATKYIYIFSLFVRATFISPTIFSIRLPYLNTDSINEYEILPIRWINQNEWKTYFNKR